MSVFQILMLLLAAFFAYRMYQHIQTLEDPPKKSNYSPNDVQNTAQDTAQDVPKFTAEQLVQKADDAFLSNDSQQALAFLYEADAKRGDNPEVLGKIGYILAQQGSYNEAISYYQKALKFDSLNDMFYNALASAYREKGLFDQAKAAFENSLKIDSENKITYYNYGNLYASVDKMEEAKEMYEKALTLDPSFQEAKDEIAKIKV